MTARFVNSQKIGILGGTLDPIHLGHLRVAEEVREGLGLEEVLIIPAFSPPHKLNRPLTPFRDRLAMVQMAVRRCPGLKASDIEAHLPTPSYSVRTLEHLQRLYPGKKFYFILGLDAFLEIATWWNYPRLPELAHLVVVSRGEKTDLGAALSQTFCHFIPRGPNEFEGPKGARISFFSVTRLDISSTRIRTLVAQGRSIKFLVPWEVEDYIYQKGLYRKEEAERPE